MDAELLSAVSAALTGAMGTDAWAAMRDSVARLYGRSEEAEAAQLDETRAELLSGDQDQTLGAEAEWRAQLNRLLSQHPRAAAELRDIVEEFGPLADGSPQVCNEVSGGSVEQVAMARSVGSVTINGSPTPKDHVDFSSGTFNGPGPVIGVQNNYGPRTASADGWPRADQLRRTALGVRPVRRFGDESALPPYVARDCDDELNTLIAGALEGGGLVVVTGEPLSGKTMTAAWALLHRNVGDGARVHTPHPGTDLRDIPAQLRGRDRTQTYVVWLDDLEGHLGEHGLTAGLLAQLAHEGVLVLATMSDEAYDTHRFGGGPASRVLSGAGTVQLNSRWSEPELARLAEAADPRLVDAARWRGERDVTEYLAVGPELWDEWRRAARRNPLGHLLVRAAIDLARCGLTRGVTPKLLSQVQEEYGPEAADADSESFEEALAWATEPRHGVTGLLVPGEWPGTWRAYGSLIADAARSPLTGPVPDKVWVRAYRELQPHDVAELDGFVAAFRLILTPQAANGDAPAMTWLGLLAENEGDTAAAEDWYRKAADLGSTRAAGALGRLLAVRVAYAEAVPHLTAAADAGEAGAAALLGQVHQHLAVHYFRIAKADGDPMAGQRLKGLLRPTGQESDPA
ncbi:ATP-binding protein [Streptomyces sp. NBC_01381]|uniref:sel1 repeat family protein n=1 Tax=Streptomyces sp. NBC_01381 TaxID=2903845 RepID=UPI002253C753|nr:sel1 repeat family protein [Streptomyces sp. NBC_01381]MCX4666704.1 ATP-binding protein [Streptomyces sp. NBC_01381]